MLSPIPSSLTPERSVIEALKRLDEGLFPVFSEHLLDPRTGRPLIHERTGKPIYRPRWTLWYSNPHTRQFHYLFTHTNEKGEFAPLDHRVIERLATDVGRSGLSAGQLTAKMEEAQRFVRQKNEEIWDQKRADWLKDNKTKVQQALENGDLRITPGTRDAKTFSYEGQGSRTSSAEKEGILLTDQEMGWGPSPFDKENK